MSKLLRVALLFVLATACTPNVSSACWALPLPWHCGWSWNPFDPCGVFSSNCRTGHCGVQGANLLAARQNRVAFRQNRRGALLSRFRDRRANRVCNRCARLQQGQCNCGGPAIGTAAMFGAGLSTMAAGPVPITTQVPVTTYRTVTVDRGSYQRVWVPNIVTERVPQTTMQPQTVWMNQPQACCGDSGFSSGALLPSVPLQQAPLIQQPFVSPQLPLGSPYSDSIPGIPSYSAPTFGAPLDSTVPLAPGTILGPTPLGSTSQPIPAYDGVPYPPQPAAARPRPARSASVLGLSTGLYSDRLSNYSPSYRSAAAPSLPGLSVPVSAAPAPSYGSYKPHAPKPHVHKPPAAVRSAHVVDDHAIGFDDWVDVGPGHDAHASGVGPTYEPKPQRYVRRSIPGTTTTVAPRRSASGMFSPVRPGTGISRARYTGK